MIALYKDPDATELFEDLGEFTGDAQVSKTYLCYRGIGFVRNIKIESGSPDIQVTGIPPEQMQDGDVAEFTIEWYPSSTPSGNGILITAEEVVEVKYG